MERTVKIVRKRKKKTEKKKSVKRKVEQDDDEEETPKKSKKVNSESTPSTSISVVSLVDTLTDPGWKQLLSVEFQKLYFKEIEKYVQKERASETIYPPHEEVFSAFNYTPIDQVKVVIIGQDPYFNPNQAHGLCFSVKRGIAVPPSLNRIYKVLEKDCPGFQKPSHGCLSEWAQRGVLMLNATLTVRKGNANSHANCGWQTFTTEVIKLLNTKEGIIYFLWGGFAQKKGKFINRDRHHVLECAHPSPMSGSAFVDSCDHFSKANDLLKGMGKEPIDWSISK